MRRSSPLLARTSRCPMPPIWKNWLCPMSGKSSRRSKPSATNKGGDNMPTNITMPALSPTMEEGNLSKWLVKEGDTVKSGDVIAEIETDKATMEVEAVDEGTVAKLVVPAGTEGVKVNALIAVLAAEGEDASAAAKSGGGAAPAKAEAPKADAPKAEAPKAEPAAAAAPKAE